MSTSVLELFVLRLFQCASSKGNERDSGLFGKQRPLARFTSMPHIEVNNCKVERCRLKPTVQKVIPSIIFRVPPRSLVSVPVAFAGHLWASVIALKMRVCCFNSACTHNAFQLLHPCLPPHNLSKLIIIIIILTSPSSLISVSVKP